MKTEYAIVTGASSGIGYDFSKQLAKKGYHLILVARRTDRLEILKQEIAQTSTDLDIHVLSLDLSKKEAPEQLRQYTLQHKLNVTVLINNAGFGLNGDFLETNIDKTIEMMQLNMITLTQLTYLFGKEMKNNKHGYILQVASIGAFQPSPYFAAYSATKAYVMLFAEALDYELKNSGVSVTTLYPGATKTEFFDVANAKVNSIVKNTLKSSEEVARIGLEAMFNRQRSVVPGTINKLTAFLTQLSPRKLTTWAAANIMK